MELQQRSDQPPILTADDRCLRLYPYPDWCDIETAIVSQAALLDPEVNIHVGAQILREYVRGLGDQAAALQRYAGAFEEPTSRYASKVFEERMRLEPIRQKARSTQVAQTT